MMQRFPSESIVLCIDDASDVDFINKNIRDSRPYKCNIPYFSSTFSGFTYVRIVKHVDPLLINMTLNWPRILFLVYFIGNIDLQWMMSVFDKLLSDYSNFKILELQQSTLDEEGIRHLLALLTDRQIKCKLFVFSRLVSKGRFEVLKGLAKVNAIDLHFN